MSNVIVANAQVLMTVTVLDFFLMKPLVLIMNPVPLPAIPAVTVMVK